MKRRTFLRRIVQGAVAIGVTASVPAALLQRLPGGVEAGRKHALAQLQRLYNDYCRAFGQPPAAVRMGSDFFRLFESELTAVARFIDWNTEWLGVRSLLFKGVFAYDSGERGYGIEMLAETPRELRGRGGRI